MMYESLETRRLMSGVTAVQVGRTLLISGTPAADTIQVVKQPGDVTRAGYADADGNVVVLGEDVDLDGSSDGFDVDRVVLAAGGGDDVLTVTVDGVDAVILGGSGNNQIQVGVSNDGDPDDTAAVYVGTGGGADTVVVDAAGNSAVWVTTGDGADTGGVVALNGGRVYIDAGAGNDDNLAGGWGLFATGTGARVEFDGGAGTDWANGSAELGGVVVINGGNGDDHLTVGTAGFGGFVFLNGGNGRDTFEIVNINAGGTVTVNGGNGRDALDLKIAIIDADGKLNFSNL